MGMASNGFSISGCYGREPVVPPPGAVQFMVYFNASPRSICVGVLVSRMAVLTACVCVVNVDGPPDTRPINVIVGTHYRHDMRGVRVQVTKIVTPHLPGFEKMGTRAYFMQKSVALLLLRRKIPDVLTEEPPRAIAIDYKGEDKLDLQDECLMLGWHFFYTGDKIYPGPKYILQRNLRLQQLNYVNKEVYCDTLVLKYEKATDDLGNTKEFLKDDVLCFRDTDYTAQPCHAMFGAPVICGSGRVIGMLMAPDAQWTNCTGYSVLAHLISNVRNTRFFECVNPLFEPEVVINWALVKQNRLLMNDEAAVIKSMYDGFITDFSSSSENDY
ncbi:uncharacterized protein LOC125240806 isoform X2 [Leguminivora glycinivorella]|uniref:uncharacterized protein LOC125240806 isoform X2 n=1 Tax=Leguminivora glycinivorella TaxID=1035111 RepID=UPI00200E7501|nr:uncharacterized protein LOC125240806 isoform X2 [Leguminivora glycinivorella]